MSLESRVNQHVDLARNRSFFFFKFYPEVCLSAYINIWWVNSFLSDENYLDDLHGILVCFSSKLLHIYDSAFSSVTGCIVIAWKLGMKEGAI